MICKTAPWLLYSGVVMLPTQSNYFFSDKSPNGIDFYGLILPKWVSHLWKRKIIFKSILERDILVARRVIQWPMLLEGLQKQQHVSFETKPRVNPEYKLIWNIETFLHPRKIKFPICFDNWQNTTNSRNPSFAHIEWQLFFERITHGSNFTLATSIWNSRKRFRSLHR